MCYNKNTLKFGGIFLKVLSLITSLILGVSCIAPLVVNDYTYDIVFNNSSADNSTSEPDVNIDDESNTDNNVSESEPEKQYFYELTAEERKLVEEVVMAESGTESYTGQCMIAQCILDACELENKRPSDIVVEYRYTKRRVKPSKSVQQAVSAVFDDGVRITEEKTLYFYAPALCTSKWHESMNFVIQVENVRFFNNEVKKK